MRICRFLWSFKDYEDFLYFLVVFRIKCQDFLLTPYKILKIFACGAKDEGICVLDLPKSSKFFAWPEMKDFWLKDLQKLKNFYPRR